MLKYRVADFILRKPISQTGLAADKQNTCNSGRRSPRAVHHQVQTLQEIQVLKIQNLGSWPVAADPTAQAVNLQWVDRLHANSIKQFGREVAALFHLKGDVVTGQHSSAFSPHTAKTPTILQGVDTGAFWNAHCEESAFFYSDFHHVDGQRRYRTVVNGSLHIVNIVAEASRYGTRALDPVPNAQQDRATLRISEAHGVLTNHVRQALVIRPCNASLNDQRKVLDIQDIRL